MRVAEPKPQPKQEKYMAERLKCKPPKKALARSEPVRQVEPQGSTDSDSEPDSDSDDEQPVDFSNLDVEPVDVEPVKPRRRDSFRPVESQPPRRRPVVAVEPPVDLDALKDKYRPKRAEKEPSPLIFDDGAPYENANDTKASPKPTGTILLEPVRPPTPPLEEIKVEPIQQTYVEMKKPLKRKYLLLGQPGSKQAVDGNNQQTLTNTYIYITFKFQSSQC